jgi:hypothetical protein
MVEEVEERNHRWRAWARETGAEEGEENENVVTDLQSAFDEVAADEEADEEQESEPEADDE